MLDLVSRKYSVGILCEALRYQVLFHGSSGLESHYYLKATDFNGYVQTLAFIVSQQLAGINLAICAFSFGSQ